MSRSGYPAFISEIAAPENRHKLVEATISGYVVVTALVGLGWVADVTGTFPWHPEFTWFVLLKLVANTLMLISLRWDRFIVEIAALNPLSDIILMTGVIYVTGGPRSPLFAIYVIEIAVIGLVTNAGITAMVAALAMVSYTVMSLLMGAGLVPVYPSPVELAGGVGWGYRLADLGRALLIIVGSAVYMTVLVRQLRQRERELEAKTHALIEASTNKSRLLTNVTHELRTPVHGISGLAEMVELGVYGPVTDKQLEAMRSIQESAERQLRLIEDLMTVARADAGTLEVKSDRVDVADTLRTCMGGLTGMLDLKQLGHVVNIEEGLPSIVADRGRLSQVVINLIVNAAKFTEPGGNITLRAREEAGQVLIEVEDTGIGIAPQDQARAFGEFQQIDNALHEREYGGIGLGLPLSKRLTELMGGTLTMRSEVGVGTTMMLRFQAAPGVAEGDRVVQGEGPKTTSESESPRSGSQAS